VSSERQKRAIRRLGAQIIEEVNVKDLDIVGELPAMGWPVVSEGDLVVMLVTDIPPELAAEGMAREIVRRLQTMRRSAGFEIADHITTYYQGEDYLRQVMTDFADYIKQETLSEQLVEGVPEEGAFIQNYQLGGYKILLGIKRLT
jgi:isoleucyl-tRNA synthetase